MALKISGKARSVISTVAPTLGMALGGPLGAMAGNLIANAIGGSPERVEAALVTQQPETLVALRKAEIDFQAKLKELGIEEERLAVQDRSSARELAKVDMTPQLWMSGLFIGGYFLIILSLIFGVATLNDGDQMNLNLLLGVLTAGIPSILAFWFGSSAGSSQKNLLLAASKPADVP